MAFISVQLVSNVFHITFGRTETQAYKLKLNVESAEVGPNSVLVFARNGLIGDCLAVDENNYPLFIGQLEIPMGDTAKLSEIVEFYNDIVLNTKEPYPTIEKILGALQAGVREGTELIMDKGDIGVLACQPDPEKDSWMIFAELNNNVDLQDALSCTRATRVFGVDPMVASVVNFQFFANQFLTAMELLHAQAVKSLESTPKIDLEAVESQFLQLDQD